MMIYDELLSQLGNCIDISDSLSVLMVTYLTAV